MSEARGRSWRVAFVALREATPPASSALEDLLLHTKALVAASPHLPPQEVARDIMFLMQLASSDPSPFGDIYNIKTICDKVCCLLMDVNSHASLGSIPSYVPSVLHFIEKFVQISLGSEMNVGASQVTYDTRVQRPTLDSLQSLGQIVHDFGDQFSSSDVVRITSLLLNLIKSPKFCLANVSVSSQDAGCALKSRDFESQRLLFVALANLLIQSGSLIPSEAWLEIIKTMRDILELLTTEGLLVEDTKSSRFYSGVLRCVQLVLSDIKASIGEYAAGLVTSLVHFFGYGLGVNHVMVYNAKKTDERFGEALSKEAPTIKAVYKPPHLRRSLNKIISHNAQNGCEDSGENSHVFRSEGGRRMFQSDSEQSDSDGSVGEVDRFKCSKARALAILSIQALARVDPKSLHAHWMLLFPAHDVLNNRRLQNSLLKTVLYDPILKVRMAAAATISLMLEGPSRAFMQMAEFRESGKFGSFMTLSCSLGQIVLQLQRGLTHLVLNEPNIGLLVASLKALSLFLGAAPFSRLPAELLPNTIQSVQKRIKGLLSSSMDQTNAICMALNCIGCALSTLPPSEQVAKMLSDEVSGMKMKNQLLQDLLDCTQPLMPSLVCVDSLQALKLAVHNYPSIMVPYWASISPIKNGILRSNVRQQSKYDPNMRFSHMPDEKVVHAAAKLLNEFLRAVSGSSFTDDSEDDMLLQSSCASQSTYLYNIAPVDGNHGSPEYGKRNESVEVNCWDESLQDYLPLLVTHSSALVRAEAITCFAGLTYAIFCTLSEEKRNFLTWTVLEMAAKDESPSVRSAACRAIGVLISFPALISRTDVLASAMDVIMHSTRDTSIVVRITASWALANLCDALRSASENDTLCNVTSLPLTALAKCAMRLAKDSDKVRANAMRALGNLARFIKFNVQNALITRLDTSDEESLKSKALQEGFSETFPWLERVVQTFISCVTTGNVKVQWNVCHALGNLFLNKSITLSETAWATSIFSILLLLLRDSKNFKIRIQAALALAVPETRRDYGESFYDVIQALVLALDSLESYQVLAPSTFKYMHALNEQLTNTCLHVLGLAAPQDYKSLQDFLLKRIAFLEGWLRSTYTAATLVDMDGGCQCIENEGNEGTCSSHLARCQIHNEKLLPPPRERIWYALNDREPFVCKEENSSKRKEDVRRVAERLIDMYKYGNHTKVVVSFEQLLMQFSS